MLFKNFKVNFEVTVRIVCPHSGDLRLLDMPNSSRNNNSLEPQNSMDHLQYHAVAAVYCLRDWVPLLLFFVYYFFLSKSCVASMQLIMQNYYHY